MNVSLSGSVLSLVIDAEMDAARRGMDQQVQLETVTGKLLTLLARYQLPATWAVADPAISAATDRILGVSAGHEIAVLGDCSWVGRTAGRTRFGNELQRRVTHGRAAGLDIQSLVLRDTDLEDHSDLVVKLGIQSIAVPHKSPNRIFRRSAGLAHVQQIRFGLWRIPVIGAWSKARRIFLLGRHRGLCKQIAAAAALQAPVVIGVNALDLAVQRGGFSELDTILKGVARRRDQGSFDIVTQAGLIARIAPERQAAPAHSILRPAA
jgi:hypothetical protein